MPLNDQYKLNFFNYDSMLLLNICYNNNNLRLYNFPKQNKSCKLLLNNQFIHQNKLINNVNYTNKKHNKFQKKKSKSFLLSSMTVCEQANNQVSQFCLPKSHTYNSLSIISIFPEK